MQNSRAVTDFLKQSFAFKKMPYFSSESQDIDVNIINDTNSDDFLNDINFNELFKLRDNFKNEEEGILIKIPKQSTKRPLNVKFGTIKEWGQINARYNPAPVTLKGRVTKSTQEPGVYDYSSIQPLTEATITQFRQEEKRQRKDPTYYGRRGGTYLKRNKTFRKKYGKSRKRYNSKRNNKKKYHSRKNNRKSRK